MNLEMERFDELIPKYQELAIIMGLFQHLLQIIFCLLKVEQSLVSSATGLPENITIVILHIS